MEVRPAGVGALVCRGREPEARPRGPHPRRGPGGVVQPLEDARPEFAASRRREVAPARGRQCGRRRRVGGGSRAGIGRRPGGRGGSGSLRPGGRGGHQPHPRGIVGARREVGVRRVKRRRGRAHPAPSAPPRGGARAARGRPAAPGADPRPSWRSRRAADGGRGRGDGCGGPSRGYGGGSRASSAPICQFVACRRVEAGDVGRPGHHRRRRWRGGAARVGSAPLHGCRDPGPACATPGTGTVRSGTKLSVKPPI